MRDRNLAYFNNFHDYTTLHLLLLHTNESYPFLITPNLISNKEMDEQFTDDFGLEYLFNENLQNENIDAVQTVADEELQNETDIEDHSHGSTLVGSDDGNDDSHDITLVDPDNGNGGQDVNAIIPPDVVAANLRTGINNALVAIRRARIGTALLELREHMRRLEELRGLPQPAPAPAPSFPDNLQPYIVRIVQTVALLVTLFDVFHLDGNNAPNEYFRPVLFTALLCWSEANLVLEELSTLVVYIPAFLITAVWVLQAAAIQVFLESVLHLAFPDKFLRTLILVSFLCLSQAFLIFARQPTLLNRNQIWTSAACILIVLYFGVADDLKARILGATLINGEPHDATYWAAVSMQRPQGCEDYQECHLVTVFKILPPPTRSA